MLGFLMGILADETFRRLIVPWIRKDRERGRLLGCMLGTVTKPANAEGMFYLSNPGRGPYYMAGGDAQTYTPPAPPSFADMLKEQAAKTLVSSFAQELMSGELGAVDEECRRRLAEHICHHKKAAAMMGFGFHNPFAGFFSKKQGAPALPGPSPANPDGGDDGGMQAAAMAMQGALSKPGPAKIFDLFSGVMENTPGTPEHEHVRHRRHKRRKHHGHHGYPPGRGPAAAATQGAWWNPFSSDTGRLLVSAVPGGTTAIAAHSIAKKALRDGSLDPNHLRKARDLAARGRNGDQAALHRIGDIKQRAGKGDRNAAVALDRIKLAHSLDTGTHISQGPGHHRRVFKNYAAGNELMRRA